MIGVFIFYLNVGSFFFFFQAEDGIRDLVRSRGLGDVYKRQIITKEEEVCGRCEMTDAGTELLSWARRTESLRDELGMWDTCIKYPHRCIQRFLSPSLHSYQ
eukprot:TRINITY_DN11531_c0_g1_i1.p1 TRINITY_DN11531_c0_g1~~TRINITY_DN11531_c0_g1_i1.p1  ORF type:complete len:102 (+),score=13.48 TRINITY_DN11531_c0_g1_i1:2-307(+)